MVHKLAILIGGLGATAVLALALGLTGLIPTAAPQIQAADTAAQPATEAAAPQTQKVVDKVYIAPTPKAPVVHVNKNNPAPAAPPAATPAPAARTASAEPENERDGGGQRNRQNERGRGGGDD
jgi:hypothetical protein